MRTNILILAAGSNTAEKQAGSSYPLCLTEYDGRSLIEHILLNCKDIPDARYTFALRQEDISHHHLDRVLQLLVPGCQIIALEQVTRGSACTALLAASQFPPEEAVLLISANELVRVDFNQAITQFRQRQLDGAAIGFRSIHPRYSYVRLDEDGFVIETAQQKPITQHATTGVFWFSKAADIVEAIKNMIRKDTKVVGSFYIAPAFNEMILKQGRIGIMEIAPDDYFPLKTERQIHQFEHRKNP